MSAIKRGASLSLSSEGERAELALASFFSNETHWVSQPAVRVVLAGVVCWSYFFFLRWKKGPICHEFWQQLWVDSLEAAGNSDCWVISIFAWATVSLAERERDNGQTPHLRLTPDYSLFTEVFSWRTDLMRIGPHFTCFKKDRHWFEWHKPDNIYQASLSQTKSCPDVTAHNKNALFWTTMWCVKSFS